MPSAGAMSHRQKFRRSAINTGVLAWSAASVKAGGLVFRISVSKCRRRRRRGGPPQASSLQSARIH